MSQDSEEYLQEYATNEHLRRSSTASASEKAAAWRRQALLLQYMTSETAPKYSCRLLEQHYNKLNTSEYQEYLEQRVNTVASLLAKRQPAEAVCANNVQCDFPELDDRLFEPACRGTYESCSSNEITREELKLLRKEEAHDEISSDSNYSNSNGETHLPVQRRSTITSFFQPQQQHQKKQQQEQHWPAVTKNNGKGCNNTPPNSDNHGSNDNGPFRTARELLVLQNLKKQNSSPTFGVSSSAAAIASNPAASASTSNNAYFNYGITKKMLGGRRTIRSGFVLPVCAEGSSSPTRSSTMELQPSPPINCSPEAVDERLLNIDPKMIELIKNEIMHTYKAVSWNDIAGLDYAKSIIKEAVVYPLLRPDIFTGLRRPPRGILLFGPPGTGKTLIGKCIASQSQSTFFSISASSLTSKWVGDSEKMVRALFAVASVHQPAVIFIDEVDSLLAKRSESEHDSSRKLKNEFLVQLDGAATSEDDRILIVGATNRPQELDDAARRRFARRLYIPLPELNARIKILTNLLETVSNDLSACDVEEIGRLTEGYSGADMDILCREASMEPLRNIPAEEIPHIVKDNVRAVNIQDFQSALQSVRPSVSQDDLKQYIKWNNEYGAVRQLR